MGWKKWMGPGAVLLAGILGFGIWKQVEADRVKTVQEQLRSEERRVGKECGS